MLLWDRETRVWYARLVARAPPCTTEKCRRTSREREAERKLEREVRRLGRECLKRARVSDIGLTYLRVLCSLERTLLRTLAPSAHEPFF